MAGKFGDTGEGKGIKEGKKDIASNIPLGRH